MNLRIATAALAGACSLSSQAADNKFTLHHPLVASQVQPNGTVVSPNWSGYAVTGAKGSVSAVYGSWVVPLANCGNGSPRNTGASHWIGIDGYTSTTVEQTGTDSDCSAGKPKYYAWYEIYPSPGTTIRTLSVEAGDVMDASVVYDGSQFVITITDERTQQTFKTSATVANAKRNSAEWIAEDNSTNFTNFNAVGFGQDVTGVTGTCMVSLDGAIPIAIGTVTSQQVHAIVMADKNGTAMALPSQLSNDGSSFSVTWQAVR